MKNEVLRMIAGENSVGDSEYPVTPPRAESYHRTSQYNAALISRRIRAVYNH